MNNMVNEFSFTEVPSPEDKLQASSYSPLPSPVSEHFISHLQSPRVLENELFLDNMDEGANLPNLRNKIIFDLTKIINKK